MKNTKIDITKLDNEAYNLSKKYRELEAFLNSIFKITNPSTPSLAEDNPLLCKLVYPKLLKLKESVLADIEAVNTLNIDVYSIVNSSSNAVSNLILYFFPNMLYKIEQDCKQLQRAEELEKTFTTQARLDYLKKLSSDLAQKELLYSNMESIGSKLADGYLQDIIAIKKEQEVIKKTLNSITLADIENDLRNSIKARLENYILRLDANIAFLARIHPVEEV